MAPKWTYHLDKIQKNDSEAINYRLNKLGEEGWELQLFHEFGGEVWAIFKKKN